MACGVRAEGAGHELYDLAQQRDSPGRSNLSKAKLVDALTAADDTSGAA